MSGTRWARIVIVLGIGAALFGGVIWLLRDHQELEASGWVKIQPVTPQNSPPPEVIDVPSEGKPTPAIPDSKTVAHQAADHVAFTPDGTLLVVSEGGEAAYRDAVTGQTQQVGVKLGAVRAIAFTPDGKRIVSINSAGEVAFRDANTWLVEETFKPGVPNVKDIAASPDGRTIALATTSGVTIWDIRDRKPRTSLLANRSCAAVSFSRDGKLLAVATQAGAVIWETTFWQQKSTLGGAMAWAVRFWPARSAIVTLGVDGSVRIYDLATRQLQTTLSQGEGEVTDFALSPDGRTIAGCGSSAVTIWDATTRTARLLR